MLLGRNTELQYLNQFYQKEESRLIVLYGREGIGKRSMLTGFCENKPCCFYEARACSEREQLFEWANELREENPTLPEYPEYGDILEQIIQKRTLKKVIVIYEFQNLIKTGKAFMDSIRKLLHNQWNNQPVLVILVSSSVGFVENSMIAKMGEAAFEITGFLKMKELGFRELTEYFEEYSAEQCMETYGVLGGVPGLWRHFNPHSSLKENICKNILRPAGILHDGAEKQVETELREPGVYHTILAAIAQGKHKLNELYLHTGFSRAKISVYLKNLMELELVEKVFSFDSAGRENTQKGIYRIRDSFVYFHFKYVYPGKSKLLSMTEEQFYDTYIGPKLQSYTAEFFAKACREYMEGKKQYTKGGEWVGKVGIIDYVGQDDTGRTVIAGCSCTKPEMPYEDYEWLLFCAKQAKIKADEVYLFSLYDFDTRLKQEAEEEKVHLIQWENRYL